jgi:hypothetical protein
MRRYHNKMNLSDIYLFQKFSLKNAELTKKILKLYRLTRFNLVKLILKIFSIIRAKRVNKFRFLY